MKKLFILLCVSFIFYTSCKTTGSAKSSAMQRDAADVYEVYITDTKSIVLLEPDKAGQEVNELQFCTARYGNQNFVFQCYTLCSKKEVSLFIMNEMGIEIGTFKYSGTELSLKSKFLPKTIRPEYFVVDIQNAYYDLKSLQSNYEKAGLRFAEEKTSSGYVRSVWDEKTLIETITVDSDKIVIQNNLRGYSLNFIREQQ